MPADSVVQYLKDHEKEHLEELKDLLSIPSISAQPDHRGDCLKAAEWVRDALQRLGVKNAKLEKTAGNPIVYGEWLKAGPDKPTVLVYGHYDVQPPEPVEKWDSPPFEPTERDGKLYARGATDDKGQMFTHLKAAEAHFAVTGGLPVNVKYLIEGEEEVGTENLERFIKDNRERLEADAVLISDTAMYDEKHPAITYSLRGINYFQLDVEGPGSDLHSGVYGGAVMNPAEAVAHILAACKSPKTGKVKVPGFYDDVVKPSREERKNFERLPFKESKLKKEVGVRDLHGEKGWSPLERMWVRPTFEVNGVWGGYTGEGAKTVIPATAHAKVSMRLVADQDHRKVAAAFKKHVQNVTPPGVKVTVTQLAGSPASRAPIEHPAVKAGMQALEDAFGHEAVLIAEGGSIPVVGMFDRFLKTPSVLMGYGLHSENLHAPNEHFSVKHFHAGCRASALVLSHLGDGGA